METHTRDKEDVKWQALQDSYLGFLIFVISIPKISKTSFLFLNE